jgi:predicted metal-dependent hydrolase
MGFIGRGEILIDGRAIPVALRRSERARRLLIRLDLQNGGIELVLPGDASPAKGFRFLEQHTGWIAARLAALPPRIAFSPGTEVPILGRLRRICHHPEDRAGVRLVHDEIRVSGAAEHVGRRVKDWLKATARRELASRARAAAAAVGRVPTRITVRDTVSRWGSCSSSGALSFSWRLILAPEAVLDYVVAHEVAHLKEMHHGPRFWALVGLLVPDPAAARTWLRQEGASLHRYG